MTTKIGFSRLWLFSLLGVLPLLAGNRGCTPPPPEQDLCVCAEIYAPVCGVDDVTYSNACFAGCEDIEVAHEGECGQSECVCEKIYAPVCGVDGRTYGNACEAACGSVTIDYEGECSDVLCLAENSCQEGQFCDHSECLSGCPDGAEACIAVCYGRCVATPVESSTR